MVSSGKPHRSEEGKKVYGRMFSLKRCHTRCHTSSTRQENQNRKNAMVSKRVLQISIHYRSLMMDSTVMKRDLFAEARGSLFSCRLH